MWEAIELRELRVFLVLAEELHFGRTAERLNLTQSRVSQSLRSLEKKLGQQLVNRTSRRVALTLGGERFLAEAGAAYTQLVDVLRNTRAAAGSLEGALRIGLLTPASGGTHLINIIEAFEAEHPGCSVHVRELPFRDRLGPLRRGEVDLMAMRLPIGEPDLVVGPTISREPRVLAVARDHPLAERKSVSIEDIADHPVTWVEDLLPKELAAEFMPTTTPTGRPIERLRVRVGDFNELITMIARGKMVHPTVGSFASFFGHPDIRYLPITDMPASTSALIWRRRDPDRRLRAFIRLARTCPRRG
jgi:DNA-binding transcriptional LysR family regulator